MLFWNAAMICGPPLDFRGYAKNIVTGQSYADLISLSRASFGDCFQSNPRRIIAVEVCAVVVCLSAFL